MLYIYTSVGLIIALFTVYIVIPSLFKIVIRRKFINSIDCSEGAIYLTYDDGPHPEATPAIVNILKKYGAEATFFVTGKNSQNYRELVRMLLDNNHAVGEHGYWHLHPWKCSPVAMVNDMVNSTKAIEECVGGTAYPTLYRPPYGKFNVLNLLYSFYKKKRIIFWTLDPKDYSARSAQEVLSRIMSSIRPGAVILLHDSRGESSNNHVNVTVKATELFLEQAKSLNLQFKKFNKVQ